MSPGGGWGSALRISWPVLGGVWGAWLGFGGYARIPSNPDSFGSMLALWFFVFFAVIGLLAGAVAGALIGGAVEALVRRCGAGIAAAMLVATVLNALALWQISGFVQAKYPGLRSQAAEASGGAGAAAARAAAVRGSGNPVPEPSRNNSCSEPPPPPQSRERTAWESECR